MQQVYSRKHALSLGVDYWPQDVPNDYSRDVEGGEMKMEEASAFQEAIVSLQDMLTSGGGTNRHSRLGA